LLRATNVKQRGKVKYRRKKELPGDGTRRSKSQSGSVTKKGGTKKQCSSQIDYFSLAEERRQQGQWNQGESQTETN
jgi:hypothetical protein